MTHIFLSDDGDEHSPGWVQVEYCDVGGRAPKLLLGFAWSDDTELVALHPECDCRRVGAVISR